VTLIAIAYKTKFQNMAALAHELRYELLQREGNRRSSLTQWSPDEPAVIHPDQIQINLQV
jgi:hypothetical protein